VKLLSQPTGIPSGIVLEKPGRNLDSLVQTAALNQLKSTVLREWNIRGAFADVEQYGIKPTTLSLFHGPPGNGKTMAAKMLASVTGSPLYRVSCDGLLNAYLGKSEQNMQDVLLWLSQAGQAVVLFDECESLFGRRTGSDSQSGLTIVRTMQIFWQSVDSWEAPQMFLLATNRVQDLDEALLSRCETQLEFVGPTKDQAQQVLDYWSETLHLVGADVWARQVRAQIDRQTPVSFRDLWQLIAAKVRHWITSNHE